MRALDILKRHMREEFSTDKAIIETKIALLEIPGKYNEKGRAWDGHLYSTYKPEELEEEQNQLKELLKKLEDLLVFEMEQGNQTGIDPHGSTLNPSTVDKTEALRCFTDFIGVHLLKRASGGYIVGTSLPKYFNAIFDADLPVKDSLFFDKLFKQDDTLYTERTITTELSRIRREREAELQDFEEPKTKTDGFVKRPKIEKRVDDLKKKGLIS